MEKLKSLFPIEAMKGIKQATELIKIFSEIIPPFEVKRRLTLTSKKDGSKKTYIAILFEVPPEKEEVKGEIGEAEDDRQED